MAAHYHIRNRKASAGLQHPEGLAQHSVLIGREVDDAIGDDYIHGVIGKGNLFHLALEEFNILHAGLAPVLARQGQHVVGHVEAVSFAGGANPLRRKQHIDPSARAKIEHGFARMKLGESGRISAAQRCPDRSFRQADHLRAVVQVLGDRIDIGTAG